MLLALALALTCAGDPVPIELDAGGGPSRIGTLHRPTAPPGGADLDPPTVLEA